MASLRRSTFGLIALDAVAVVLCFNLAMYLRGIPGGLVVTPLLVPMLVSMLAIYLVDGYKSHTDMMSVDYTSQHTIALLAALVITVLLTFVVVPGGYELQSSRIVVLLSYVILIPITLSYRRVAYARAARALRNRRVVFVGDAASCRIFAEEYRTMGATFPVVYSFSSGIQSGYSTPPMSLDFEADLRPIAEVLDEIQTGNLPVEAIVLRETKNDLPELVSQRLMQLYFQGVPTYTLEL
ncbi:MAG: polyprenyl glycosylphosphotransferase, partial [Opitutaceae bacterium]|nr:polyprenyl glycosylphosphotransferase [Opitutaceae bacterium]